ncbi:hypothetical protein CZP2022_69 [Vibrio phage C-ZP2022]|nr:hypothetical protein CZP2022_69 [Vibrio phage C-ZP2022]
MSILLTVNPASLPVTAGQAYSANDIRTLAVDATADDTMTNWKFPDCNSKAHSRLSMKSTPTSTLWFHARVKRTVSSFEIGVEFYGQPSGYSSTYKDYWGLQVTPWFMMHTRNQTQQNNQSFSGTFPAEGSDWFDFDLEMGSGKVYINGSLEHDYSGSYILGTDSSAFQFRIQGGEITEMVVANEDTRNWRVASEVPASLVSSTFSGDVVNIQTPGLTKDGLSSGGAGAEFVAKMPVVPGGYKVAGHTINTIAETNGTPESPMLAYILDGNLLGLHSTDSDGENVPNSFVHETKPSDGSNWSTADLSEREITVINPVEHYFNTAQITSGVYGTGGAAQFVKGGEWDGGGAIELQHAYSARNLWIFCDADTNRKWGTSDKIHVYYTRRDVAGQPTVNRVLTWDDTTGGYKSGLSNDDFDVISASGMQMKMYILPL